MKTLKVDSIVEFGGEEWIISNIIIEVSEFGVQEIYIDMDYKDNPIYHKCIKLTDLNL